MQAALDNEKLSYRQIGEMLGCTGQRVGQILSARGIRRQRVQVAENLTLARRFATRIGRFFRG
uniref:Uncharacterized protein n=1 Tax=viral metagenome TaxID=1070528 RepID=A0A6M3KXK0_9ZZZZ